MSVALPQLGSSILTNSRLRCARECPRKHQFRYEIGLRPSRVGSALRLGSAVHVGLEALALGRTMDEAAAAATSSYELLPEWCKGAEQVEDWMVERETVAAMIAGHSWRWGGDGIEHVCAEQAFDMPIVNPETGASTPTWRLAGKIDAIVRLPDGRMAVKENKTTGDAIDPEADYWKRLRIDSQISTYWLAATHLGHRIETVLYDVIRKPGISPRRLTKAEAGAWDGTWFGQPFDHGAPERETPAMYGARLLADMGERPDFYFARREIPRLESDIEEFRSELWEQAADLRERRRSGRWYRNSNACIGFGRCEYIDLCSDGYEAGAVPPGFEIVKNLHPELEGKP